MLGQPQPLVHPTRAWIVPGTDPEHEQTRGSCCDEHPPPRGDEDEEEGEDDRPRGERQIRTQADADVRRQHREDDPPDPAEDVHRNPEQNLKGLHSPGRPCDRALRSRGSDPRPLFAEAEPGQRTEARMRIDVADGDAGMAGAQPGHELSRGQGAAAGGEEVRVTARPGAEDRGPLLPDPLRVIVEDLIGSGIFGTGIERPRQSVAIDLAGRLRRQVLDQRQAGNESGRQLFAQSGFPVGQLVLAETGAGGEVADEDVRAGRGPLHRGRRSFDTGQRLQGRIDLAEFDAPAAELDLLIGTTDEDQPGRVVDDEVAGPVRPLPAEARHGGELLGVLGRIEIAGQSDSADDELTGLAFGDGNALGIDDGQHPSLERQTDAHGLGAVEHRRAGDDGGLGGTVGVPHLPIVLAEASAEFGRAGLTAEDEEANIVETLRRPQCGECRHGRDDGDLPRRQPRAQVHSGLHQRTRSRDEACAVPPRQPHLLTGGVEGHGQSGEDPVSRPQRLLDAEQGRLGVDEGRG